MRVVNEKFETITKYDKKAGKLVPATSLREGATPPDNITKFAYSDADYEPVKMYIPYPVKTTKDKIAELKKQLEATDYRVIKCSECQLLGEEMPYDIKELHAERQAIRDEINKLEQEE